MNDIPSMFQSPRFKELLARYEEMVASGKSTYFESEELIRLAEYYASQNNTQRSETVVEYGLYLHPDNIDLLIFKGHNLLILGRLKEAEKLINSLPDYQDYETRLLRAELMLAQGEKQQGLELLCKLYDEEQDIDSMLDIAQVCMDTQYQEEAYYWLQKAYQKEPDKTEVMEMMASYHFTFQNYEETIGLYNKLLDRNPYCVEFWQNLARCYMRTDNIEKAMEAIDFALTIDAKNLISMELKSYIYFLIQEPEEGFKWMEAIEQEAKDKSYIQQAMLVQYFILQRHEKIVEYCDKLLKYDDLFKSERSAIYYKRAIAHLMLKQEEEGDKDIEAGLFYDAENWELLLLKGERLLGTPKKEEADPLFEAAFHFADYGDEAMDAIAFAYFRNQEFEKALQTFLKREEKYPENVQYNYYCMAFCYYILQDDEKARIYLRRAAYYDQEFTLGSHPELFSGEQGAGFMRLAKEVFDKMRYKNPLFPPSSDETY